MDIDPVAYARQLEQTVANLFLDNQRLISLVSGEGQGKEIDSEQAEGVETAFRPFPEEEGTG